MGCVLSTAIACLICNHKCSMNRLVSEMAFHPPKPATYRLKKNSEGSDEIEFEQPGMKQALRLLNGCEVSVEITRLQTSRKETIVCFRFGIASSRLTILWSHANAMDCGEMYFFFAQLAERLQVTVVAYDYSGYGCSTGTPSEANCNADVLAVYDDIVSRGCHAESELIVYGQSIGSVPTLWLATARRVRSVVLHTPLLSGLRFLVPPPKSFCSLSGFCGPLCLYSLCDPFPNMHRIKKVTAPVLLIHGTCDETIDCSHTFKMHALCPPQYRQEPYVVEGAGHENIVEMDRETYFSKLASFLQLCSDSEFSSPDPPQGCASCASTSSRRNSLSGSLCKKTPSREALRRSPSQSCIMPAMEDDAHDGFTMLVP